MRNLQCWPANGRDDDAGAQDGLFRLVEKLKKENFFGKCIVDFRAGTIHRVEVCRMMTVDDLKSI